MEFITESNGNMSVIPENKRNCIDDENENPENVSTEEQKQSTATADPPNIIVLHEDVKKYIENFVQQRGYNYLTLDVEIGSNLGDNFMGFIGKLTLTCLDNNNERKTFNWVVKTAPTHEIFRAMLNISLAYQRETYLYKSVFQIFRDFQNEKHIQEPFNQHPEFITSYEETLKETIVMKDMKSLGYIMRPRQEPLDLNHVKLVMKAYAKLHAISYALKDQKPDVFKEIAENTKDIMLDTTLSKGIQEIQRPVLAMVLSALDSTQDAKVLSVFKKFLDNYPDILAKLLRDPNERAVISHGDSWINNMMWKYDVPDSNIPTKVCLVDWQLARYGSPVCDLSYFLFTCTSKEFRDKHYDNMIGLYYFTLCAHLTDLGSDPQKYLSLESLQDELKTYSLVGLFSSIVILFVIMKDASEIPEWRSNHADQEAVMEQWMERSQNFSAFNKRIRGLVLDFYARGYFNDLL